MATKKEIMSFFDSFSGERSKIMENAGDIYNRKRLIDSIIKEADISEKNRLIDIGCGSGEYLKILEKKGMPSLYGTDFSTAMTISAKKNTKTANYAVCDLEYCAYKSNSFDAIITISVLQYISSYADTFRELGRILKPGGTLAIKVINLKGQNLKNLIIRHDRYDFRGQPKNESLDLRLKTIKIALEKSGFAVEKTKTMGFVYSSCPEPLLPLNILIQSVLEKTPLCVCARDLVIIARKKKLDRAVKKSVPLFSKYLRKTY